MVISNGNGIGNLTYNYNEYLNTNIICKDCEHAITCNAKKNYSLRYKFY